MWIQTPRGLININKVDSILKNKDFKITAYIGGKAFLLKRCKGKDEQKDQMERLISAFRQEGVYKELMKK